MGMLEKFDQIRASKQLIMIPKFREPVLENLQAGSEVNSEKNTSDYGSKYICQHDALVPNKILPSWTVIEAGKFLSQHSTHEEAFQCLLSWLLECSKCDAPIDPICQKINAYSLAREIALKECRQDVKMAANMFTGPGSRIISDGKMISNYFKK